MKKEEYEKLDNRTKNLVDQVQKMFKNNNQKSIKTRYRYRDAEERFCKWLSKNTNLNKLKNVKIKHFKKYTEELKNKGLSPSMIKTELSAIRYFHQLTGSKERLPENKFLNLQKTNFGGVNRAWTPGEVKKALNLAKKMGRIDVQMAIKISYAFGTRLEEFVTLSKKQIKDAIKNLQLDLINTKGNKPRGIQMQGTLKNMQLRALQFCIENALGKDKIFIKTGQQTHRVKKSIEDWVYATRNKFQDDNRIHRNEAREIVRQTRDKGEKATEMPSASLTLHGLRHSYAQNMYKQIKEELIKEELKKRNDGEKIWEEV